MADRSGRENTLREGRKNFSQRMNELMVNPDMFLNIAEDARSDTSLGTDRSPRQLTQKQEGSCEKGDEFMSEPCK